jgi:hypothetical protein
MKNQSAAARAERLESPRLLRIAAECGSPPRALHPIIGSEIKKDEGRTVSRIASRDLLLLLFVDALRNIERFYGTGRSWRAYHLR